MHCPEWGGYQNRSSKRSPVTPPDRRVSQGLFIWQDRMECNKQSYADIRGLLAFSQKKRSAGRRIQPEHGLRGYGDGRQAAQVHEEQQETIQGGFHI